MAEQLTLDDTLDATVADVWATYFPGVTQDEAYWQHRRHAEAVGDLYGKASRLGWRHVPYGEPCDCSDRQRTAEECASRREAYEGAWREWHLLRGTPEQWIGWGMNNTAPLGICQTCWRPGADTVEHRSGARFGYHSHCLATMEIRSDLRSAAWARIHGNEERAQMWEARALATHNGTQS